MPLFNTIEVDKSGFVSIDNVDERDLMGRPDIMYVEVGPPHIIVVRLPTGRQWRGKGRQLGITPARYLVFEVTNTRRGAGDSWLFDGRFITWFNVRMKPLDYEDINDFAELMRMGAKGVAGVVS